MTEKLLPTFQPWNILAGLITLDGMQATQREPFRQYNTDFEYDSSEPIVRLTCLAWNSVENKQMGAHVSAVITKDEGGTHGRASHHAETLDALDCGGGHSWVAYSTAGV